MNVTYKCNKGNAFICADGVQKMMASYEDVEELLILSLINDQFGRMEELLEQSGKIGILWFFNKKFY